MSLFPACLIPLLVASVFYHQYNFFIHDLRNSKGQKFHILVRSFETSAIKIVETAVPLVPYYISSIDGFPSLAHQHQLCTLNPVR